MRAFPVILRSSFAPSCPGSAVPFRAHGLPLTQCSRNAYLHMLYCDCVCDRPSFPLCRNPFEGRGLVSLRSSPRWHSAPPAGKGRLSRKMLLADKAVAGPVLAPRGTEKSKTVLVLVELHEWGRQTSEQAVEREIGEAQEGLLCEMGVSASGLCSTQQALVSSVLRPGFISSITPGTSLCQVGKGRMLSACFRLPSKLSSVWLVPLEPNV